MSAQTINLELSVPPFPEGAKMSPGQFAEWLVENITFEATGAFVTGQIGGAQPGPDQGIWMDTATGRLQYWDGAKYATVLTVPIGAMIPWTGALLTPPDDDYIFADGSLFLKTDYPLLANVLGTSWSAAGDDSTMCRLPNPTGRAVVGSGSGTTNPKADPSIATGVITPRSVGDYFGLEWPKNTNVVQGMPGGRFLFSAYGGKPYTGTKYTSAVPPSLATTWIIRAK